MEADSLVCEASCIAFSYLARRSIRSFFSTFQRKNFLVLIGFSDDLETDELRDEAANTDDDGRDDRPPPRWIMMLRERRA
ncbi:MAG: hypothetical protein JSR89_02260 [Proteobacteria bacterium]|nr:hypothetical protein [Pseudomonadota bacterium]